MRGPLLAVIPARGGSKGIPGKNIKRLAGKPLISYSIDAARKARGIDRLIVDTDDPAIAAVARKCGAAAPWLRPPELATDASPVTDAILHLLGRLKAEEGLAPAGVLLLQLTSPLRSSASIEAGIRLFRKVGGESVVSVSPMTEHPYCARRLTRDHRIVNFIPGAKDPACRQDLPPAFMLDGNIFITTPANLRARRAVYGPRPFALLTPPEEFLDIDTPADWELAEFRLSRRRRLRGHAGRASGRIGKES